MRIGLCGSMVVNDPGLGGVEVAPLLASLGYDYIELSISHLTALDHASFAAVRKSLYIAGIPCECCNNFFPPYLKLTGPDVHLPEITGYAKTALGRAAELGASIVVLGSGQAKSVPEGFPLAEAWSQLQELCYLLSKIARKNNITIALEPLRRAECNIINSVEEALRLCHAVNLPEIRVLADYYHLKEENESPLVLLKASRDLYHVHFANPAGRTFPLSMDEDAGYAEFFSALRKIIYCHRISIEGYSVDHVSDAMASLAFLKGYWQELPESKDSVR